MTSQGCGIMFSPQRPLPDPERGIQNFPTVNPHDVTPVFSGNFPMVFF